MNISRIDGSRYGAVLFGQPSPAANSITRSRAVRIHNGRVRPITGGAYFNSRHNHPSQPQWHHPRLPPPRSFCSAVAPAGGRLPSSNYFTAYPASVRSWNHTAAPTAEPTEGSKRPHISTHYERRVVEQSKKEMLDMVDYYDDEPVDEYMKFYGDPFLRTYASANGPNITISDKKEDLELQTINGDRGPDDKQFEPARNLQSALASWHRRPSQHFLDTIWDLYQALPEPRPAHMHARTRHSLMAALASVERRDLKSMLRYFAVVADVKNSGFSLTRVQWNKALSFASRYVATTTEVELEAALKLWRSMEKEANIRGNEATFNILFDCASKAGKFDLAEMIYKEMARRGFAFNRFHHVSLIHFLGLKMDSSGVRAAYKEMVEAGEIIDTVVLNCLIASFIRCGEEQSAEYVYEKMKASNKDLPVPPHRDYTMGKAIKKVLGMFARVGKQYPSMLPEFQKSALLSPDLHTYRILLYHYGLRLGSLSKVVQFLDEMSAFTVPFNGMVFLILFRSFAKHGGAGSEWSAQRLNRVWEAFLNALDSEVDGLYISTWLAMAILKAHARYATKDEMLDVFDCLRSRWELDSTNTQYMLQFLQSLLKTGRFACVF